MTGAAADPTPDKTIPASVIVVSRHRPGALLRCLTALAQSDHPCFEVIVVADPGGLAAVAQSVFRDTVKTAACDVANIPLARNTGLGLAAAPVVAFIDDDAVAESTWLSRLTAPFANPRVSAAGGFVRGRNGISHQWKAREIDRDALETPLTVDETRVSLHRPATGRAIKTEGTNCAFRRRELMRIGGFDPAYAFFLDEADVNMRLTGAGATTAIVPGAEVHHGFAASERRNHNRAPLSLHDIGASTAAFLRRHGGDRAHALARLRSEQRRRLLRMMVDGRLTPGDVGRLLTTLEAGIADGMQRPLGALKPLASGAAPFLPLEGTGPRPHRVIAGWFWRRAALHRAALALAASGDVVTVIRLSPGARPHRMRFAGGGYWEQTGGVLGPAERDGPKFIPMGLAQRTAREVARISAVRPELLPADMPKFDDFSLFKRV